MSVEIDLYIDQGADYYKEFIAIDSQGEYIDLEGWVIRAQMRKYYGSTFGYTFSTGVAGDTENGILYISMNKDETRDIPAGRYLYDVEITSPLGERYRLAEGIIEVTPEITKL